MKIKCNSCGSEDVSFVNSAAGFKLYSCNNCGEKFIKDGDGYAVLDKYVIERGRVFAAIEGAKLRGGDTLRAIDELESLMREYPTLAEIDPIYSWYKIEMLTAGFKDLSRYDEAKEQCPKLVGCYFVTK